MTGVSRVCTLVFSGATGSRTWQATAASQDTAAGGSVVVTVTQTAGGISPAAPDTFTLNYYNDNGGLEQTVALTAGSASQTHTFTFSKAGTVEIALRVTKTTGGPTNTYDYETDGSPSTALAAFPATQVDRGWIRGTTTGTLSTSNVAFGGAVPALFAWPDTLYQRLALGHALYVSRTVTLDLGGVRSGASSAGTQTFDRNQQQVDNSFLAAATALTQSVTVGNATLTGLPFTVLTATTAPAVTVDPRLYRQSLFQLDDNTWGTPPASKHVSSRRRLVTQQAFLADRTLNARSEGVNGITYNFALTPDKPGSPITATGLTTTTQGGLAGYSSQFTPWQSSLPSGIWRKSIEITGPANKVSVFDTNGARYTLGVDATETGIYTLIAPDPNIFARMNVQHEPGLGGRHFSAGMALIATSYLINVSTGVRIPSSAVTFARVSVVRATAAAQPDGTGTAWEYLDATLAWNLWTDLEAQSTFALSASSADTATFERRFVTDSTWGTRDIRFNIAMEYEGVLYATDYIVVNVDGLNRHDGYVFDGAGFVGFPSK